MENLTTLIVAGILTEGVTEVFKQIRQDGKINKTMLMSILVGEGVAFATQLDIIKMLGFETVIPFFGIAVTGLLISRGSNYIADLVTKLTNTGKQDVTYIFEEDYEGDIEEMIKELEDISE